MDWLSQLAAHLGLWILGLGILTVIVIVLLVVWLRRHREREEEAAAQAAEAEASLSPASPALRGELTLSFFRALKYLRSQSTGRRRLYRVPWYLLLGQAGAGKTAIAQALGHAAPGALEGAQLHHRLGWNFFDHGVVLDVPGEYVLDPYSLDSQERHWRTLLRLLNRARPRRPCDGVVLVLPVTDFLPSSELSGADLAEKARKLADKLSHLQREAGVCFPVYILLSQCDRVPGFSSFCAALPPVRRKEIFGWSSPYRADTSFEPQWVDEAFEEIARSLARVQSELFAEPQTAPEARGLFFFPNALVEVRERLRLFLHQVFRSTSYRDAYYCRGLYCTGDGPEALAAASPLAATEPNAANEPIAAAELLAAHAPGAALELALPPAPAEPHPVFLDELFERKIFPEWGLAFPEAQAFSLRRNTLLSARTAVVALAVVLAIGLGLGYLRLSRLQQQALPLLASIHDAADTSLHLRLVRDIAALGDERFVSLFYPASWSRRLDGQVQQAVSLAFERHVFDVQRRELTARLAAVAPPVANTSPAAAGAAPSAAASDSAAAQLTSLPQYATLLQYTRNVSTLEDAVQRYERLATANSPQPVADLNALLAYLHPGADTSITSNEESYYSRALAEATGRPISAAVINAARQRVHAGMVARVDALYSAWFENNPGVGQLQDLADQISLLHHGSAGGYAGLMTLQASLQQAAALLNSPQAVWFSDPSTLFSGALGQVTLVPVEHSAANPWGLFYPAPDLESYLRSGASAGWQDLHLSLAALSTNMTGPLLAFGPRSITLSPAVKDLQLPLVNLLGLSFMAPGNGGNFGAAIPPGSSLSWNPAPLGDAVTMVNDYQRYVAEGLSTAPLAVRASFRQIALEHLQANLDAQLGAAQVWTPATGAASDRATLIQNLQAAMPQLRQLLGDMDTLGAHQDHARLLALLNQQAFGLLRGLEAQLEAHAAYDVREGLASWDGTGAPLAAVFDLHSPDDLTNYLAFQRQRLVTLAQAAAPLVELLQQLPAPARSAAATALLNRWQALAAAVTAYQARQPGNPLSRLQDFITSDLNKITPAAHCQPAPEDLPLAGSGFLVHTRERLWRAVYTRCRELDRTEAHQNYAGLAADFNRTLAGKFPFAAPAAAGTVEAEPSAIAAFYAQLDSVQPSFGAQLAPAAAAFISTMEQLRPLWAASLTHPATAPVLAVTPTFRVHRAQERGGNQIIAWTLKIGANTFAVGDAPASAAWTLSEPITLTLQWAANSPRVPALPHMADSSAPPAQPAIRGRTVTYTYDDPWSLLALVSQQRAPASELMTVPDTTPVTLAFSIPTAPADTPNQPAESATLVFIRLAIKSPGTVESLRIPQFPRRAPLEDGASHAGSYSQ